MDKLVRIIYNHLSNELISVVPLISESKTTITYHTPNGNKFSANILKKETNTIYFDSYYVDSVMQIEDLINE